MTPWLLLAIPFLGAGLGLLMNASLQRMKTVALATTGMSLLAVIGTSLVQSEPAAAMSWLCLLPVTAFLTLLGQPLHRDNRSAWIITLILLGVTLGILTSRATARELLLMLLLGLVCGLLYRHQQGSAPATWRGMSSFGLGIMTTVMALALPAPASTIASLVTCATLLPLLPLHSGFVAALGVLPGNLKNVVTQLQNTLAFKNYRLLTTVIQRSKLGGSRTESGNINSKGTAAMGEQNLSANYQFRINGIWADARENAATAINFENLSFNLSGVTPDDQRQIGFGEIQTQLTSRDGETVVVGTASLKDKGLILVLSNKIIK